MRKRGKALVYRYLYFLVIVFRGEGKQGRIDYNAGTVFAQLHFYEIGEFDLICAILLLVCGA